MTTVPKLALGPILYYWSKQQVEDFYQRVANTAVDIVYLGETICSKRRIMRTKDWIRIGEQLQAQGKTVILSTLTLLEAASELGALKRLCVESPFLIEANDIAAVQILNELGKPFVTGPSVNIYNSRTLKKLSEKGLLRWTLPVELSATELAEFQQHRPDNVETEVFAWGRLPLAYSARCFTARAENLQKDDCQFRCLDYPDGLLLSTREDEAFLCINGIQTQSARTMNLLGEIDQLIDLGVDVLRISPQSRNTIDIIDRFTAVLSDPQSPKRFDTELEGWMPTTICNGYWNGNAGMER
ncbi:MAG: U32 family peptidase [Gammaproteobacteria bacterium]|nr:MAG: U32 family peptidase [Gammaproteobacteria bacterium]